MVDDKREKEGFDTYKSRYEDYIRKRRELRDANRDALIEKTEVKAKKENREDIKEIIDEMRRREIEKKRIVDKQDKIEIIPEEEVHGEHHYRDIVKYAAYSIPIIVLILILFFVLNPFSSENVYSLDVGKGDMNSAKALYLEQSNSLSPEVRYGDKNYREIISNRVFNLVFKSPVMIEEGDEVSLKLDFLGKNTNLYLNNILVFPNMENYTKLREYDSVIYYRNDLENYTYDLVDAEDVSTFLALNFPGSVVYSDYSIEMEEPVVSDYKKEDTILDNKFRDNLKLAVYGEDLNISFKKQDLNWYTGEDEVSVIVRDLGGNILQNITYGDDGNILNNSVLGEEYEFGFSLENPRGVYFISFEKDKNNRAPDYTLNDISINSNKILILGDFIPTEAISLYVKNYLPKDIGFYYWHGGKDQDIEIYEGNKTILPLTKEDFEKWVYSDFEPGERTFNITKGYVKIRTIKPLSINKEGWFNLPILNQERIDNPDFIILKDVEITRDGFSVVKEIESSDQEQRFMIRADRIEGEKIRFDSAEVMIER